MEYLAPDFNSAALLTIDTQVDTLDRRPLEIPGTSEVVPKIAALASVYRQAGRPIVHVVRLYRPRECDEPADVTLFGIYANLVDPCPANHTEQNPNIFNLLQNDDTGTVLDTYPSAAAALVREADRILDEGAEVPWVANALQLSEATYRR
jgi:nicotinamidase-related amidase